MTTPLWTFWTRDSRHWFSILWVRTQYDRPERNRWAQFSGVTVPPHSLLTTIFAPATTGICVCALRFCCSPCIFKNKENTKPPVTSHIWVMAESSVGTLPSCSLSGLVAPGNLSTKAKRRWSQRKGSLVNSLPTNGECKGKCSWRQHKERKSRFKTDAVVLKCLQTQSLKLVPVWV